MKGGKMSYTGINDQAGYLRSEPVSAYFVEVQKLRREERLDEAITSLLALIDATEEDELFTGSGVESAYYEALAQIYRERKEYLKEIKILARYDKRRHVDGDSRQEILRERLELLMKTRSTG
jgi:hypothetical protein